ncbi:bifunctional 3-(3-hydroxy-phenyl)propionate/3-hydroxycinnamic acid hydroxylase [Hoyosella subflava]|uniref:Conserved hypothetical hydroxylase n=1 Tax=Hoyosella subflava (strain DSM 45089 / JCM 17490 / NBRC 109087 / DQS3-9A1) TaxID=443218 RepID=F6EF42_HOYSD|nr:bifunctional 3-(3-hydroxy-phenyl)propionate/3-hydroxycinnamic acid hydroxylase [Hoyosella subflava]AEF38621.1 Conserved hypothetical hydroxylase [Hoyosella subflava DQS3-9A1]
MSEINRVDVIIVGAGPVGLTLANILGQNGVTTKVVEERATLIDYPRGVGLDDESLRAFQAVGLAHAIVPHTVPNQVMRFVNSKRRVIAEIAPSTQPYGWPRRNGFVQPLVDAELLEGLGRFSNVSVEWGQAVLGLTDRGDRVEVVTSNNGQLQTIEASYVVGCDGGRSVTRRLIDTTFEGTTSPTRWLVIDIANDPLGTPNIYVGADPSRPFVSVAIAHGIRRFEFMVKDDESTEEANTPAYLHARLKDFLPRPETVEIIRSRVYTHHSRIAGSFRKGRVFLAGDAAHLMPVWQGQGYNSGIRDANNLGWKLAAVVNGLAADRLLDSYDTERRKHAQSMIDLSTMVGKVISPTNRVVAGIRDAFLLSASRIPSLKRYIMEMRFKPMPSYQTGAVVHEFSSKGRLSSASSSGVGSLFVQPKVTLRGGDVHKLDEVLGTGFSVLAWGNSPKRILDKDVAADWLGLGARFVTALPLSQLHWNDDDDPDVTVVADTEDVLRQWFDSHDDAVLFIRPDRAIAGSCIAQDADALARKLIDTLGMRSPERS